MSLQYHFGGLQFLQNMARVFASIVSLCLGILDRLLQQLDLQRQRPLLKCNLSTASLQRSSKAVSIDYSLQTTHQQQRPHTYLLTK